MREVVSTQLSGRVRAGALSTRRWLRGTAAAATLAAPLVLSACAGYTGVDYARAACGDLSSLMELESPSPAEVGLRIEQAAARAHRAAELDSSLEDFAAALEEVEGVGAEGSGLDPRTEKRVDDALAYVASECEGLAAPIGPDGGVPADVTWRTLSG